MISGLGKLGIAYFEKVERPKLKYIEIDPPIRKRTFSRLYLLQGGEIAAKWLSLGYSKVLFVRFEYTISGGNGVCDVQDGLDFSKSSVALSEKLVLQYRFCPRIF